jgi:hypothetical protein
VLVFALGLLLLFVSAPSVAQKGWGFDFGSALFGTGLLACALALQTVPLAQKQRWSLVLAAWLAWAGLAYYQRKVLGFLHSRAIACSSLLLSAPAMLLPALGVWGLQEACMVWFAPALFFPSASLMAQSVIRGQGLSPWALAGLLGLAGASFWYDAMIPGFLVLAYALVFSRRAHARKGQPHLQILAVKRLGWEQALWSFGLWAWWLFEMQGR